MFWQLCGGVNGDLLQEGICHTQVCCPQSPSLLHCPLLACTSTGDTQTQFCLSLCGVPGSGCMQDLFEPSEYFWRVRDSILNVISSLLPSCWGFSFARGPEVSPQSHSSSAQLLVLHLPTCWGFSALGRGVSPHSHSSACCLTGFFLTLDVWCLHTAGPAKHSHCS